MRVMDNGDGSFSLVGLDAEGVAALGALADFPLWSAQPVGIANTCAALHDAVSAVVPGGPHAEACGMVPMTTVN